MYAGETHEFAVLLQAFASNQEDRRVHVKEFHTFEGNYQGVFCPMSRSKENGQRPFGLDVRK